jgi:2-polyprenyl-6-methoxyphenol hydroxylase-like FAD-dependent oxidoreductase
MPSSSREAQVIVVGAGPVGLAAALWLSSVGISTLLLEADDAPGCEGSRAICVERTTLEILHRLGVDLVDAGVSWTLGRTYFRKTELFQTRFPESGRETYPPFINISQADQEAAMLEVAAGSPLIDLRCGRRVIAVDHEGEEVSVTTEGAHGTEEFRAPWVLACDGAHSTVRSLLGIPFDGHSHPDRFLIADIKAALPFPDERRFFFDPPHNPGRQVLIHPQPNSVWRIDWQVPEDTDAEEERRRGRLDERIRAIIGDRPFEVVWLTGYRFHQRRARRFRAGRVFLVGDAAHLFAPFGARGMNSGVQDAENLAWKLWLVLVGAAPAELLDTYEIERIAAADENLRVTDATMRWMAPGSRWRLAKRNAILRGSVHSKSLRRLVDSGRLSEPFTYGESPIVAGDNRDSRALRPGSPPPDAQCEVAGKEVRFRELLGKGFVVLDFCDHLTRSAARVRAGRSGVVPHMTYLVTSDERAVARPLPATAHWLLDRDGTLAGTLRGSWDEAEVLRPDGHLAVRIPAPTPESVETALNFAAGQLLPLAVKQAPARRRQLVR